MFYFNIGEPSIKLFEEIDIWMLKLYYITYIKIKRIEYYILTCYECYEIQ